jgi:hypothetical protein
MATLVVDEARHLEVLLHLVREICASNPDLELPPTGVRHPGCKIVIRATRELCPGDTASRAGRPCRTCTSRAANTVDSKPT